MCLDNRGPCRECPWVKNNNYSLKFRDILEKMKYSGKADKHACHMITTDIWGLKSNIDNNNVCVGLINFIRNK